MQTHINYRYLGYRADVGHLPVMRLLPNNQTKAIGPFVFLDHMLPTRLTPTRRGVGAHPHRGIATFTYLLSGVVEHYDSKGNHGIVSAGGIQWMKAGSGVIHEENVPQNMKTGVDMHGMQFWINLPPKQKAESPSYIPVQATEIPEFDLPDQVGSLKLLLGEYAGIQSAIDAYSDQFMYHIKLNPGAKFVTPLVAGREYAIFLPEGDVQIDGEPLEMGELAVLNPGSDPVRFANQTSSVSHIIFFGGAPYTDPIVSYGPFVMNNSKEISEAYRDFEHGQYGNIKYIN